MTTRFACITVCVMLGMGCASDVTEPPPSVASGEYDSQYGTSAQIPQPADCDHPPAYEEVSAFNTCVMCHSATRSANQRTGAPLTVNFDTESAAEANSMRAVSVVKGGLMPPSSAGLKLSEEEKQELYDWAMCSQ